MERDRGWRGWHEFCRPADAGTGRPIPTDVGNPPPRTTSPKSLYSMWAEGQGNCIVLQGNKLINLCGGGAEGSSGTRDVS